MAEVFHACGCSNAHECRCYLRAGKGCGTCRPCLANIATLDATGVAGKRICALSIAPRDFIQVPPAGVKLEFKLSALREAGLGLGPLDPRFPYLLVKQFRVVVEDIHQSAAELLASQEARLAELCRCGRPPLPLLLKHCNRTYPLRETMSLHDKPPAGESDNPDLRWTNSAVVHGAMQRVQVRVTHICSSIHMFRSWAAVARTMARLVSLCGYVCTQLLVCVRAGVCFDGHPRSSHTSHHR